MSEKNLPISERIDLARKEIIEICNKYDVWVQPVHDDGVGVEIAGEIKDDFGEKTIVAEEIVT